MKRIKLSCQFILVVLLAVFASCSNDSEDPTPNPPAKSDAKTIIVFKFSAFNPEVGGIFIEAEKKINLIVPNGTDVTALVPTIVVSEKATISPTTAVAQNFKSPVEYTVTAEDGTTQKYTVTVTVSTAVSFTLSPMTTPTDIEQDGVLILDGTQFGSYENNKVVLKNKTTGTEVEIKAASASTATRLFFKIPADLVLGDYTFTVFVGAQSLQAAETLTIVLHAPTITSVDKTTVNPEDVIVITGKYFAASGNEVKLEQDGFVFTLKVITESATSISAQLPENIFDGEHTLSVISNDIERFYGQKITVAPPANKPEITQIDKSTYNKGDVMTLTGKNLKKTGVVTYIYFVPFTSGVGFTGSGVVNSDGTVMTFTIPSNLSAGTYEVIVDVDGTESESYRDIIKIN
ncbi:DUF5018 domain-containing protein [Chryseolinea soli]|uniref:DUF5018 domain-containing protein n=1 Tax=Chryseolinea soli TaxID=2321403 RepID=A0A385SJ79_9BACT|nr:DUF5018 domain-containing protein [Chryseolinea soli]AYB30984.1 DUF5018 domain-containing protein [Chryseolinea soli]